ncbi:MAG: hypothetical protein P4L77_12085 [Sulfuriferula sp.]|nr:hypothetical protein [Sulfuriferula sp.]
MERPFSSDVDKGFLCSGGMGNALDKMLREAGVSLNDCYVTCRRPNTDAPNAVSNVEGALSQYQPPFILAMNEIGNVFLPELRAKKDPEEYKGQLQKNAGSLLISPNLHYPHYMMPFYGPDRCMADWTERNVTTFFDFQKLREELKYYHNHHKLQPLPERVLKFHDMELDELLGYIDQMIASPYVSNDIENPVYRTKDYYPHPGYPILIGLANSPRFGISFRLFRDKPSENRELWKRLEKMYLNVTTIGQNFFNYDSYFYKMLGFSLNLHKIQDTLQRHHILWPELSHKLQFMTRQYTREPYYKDEGHNWSYKYMNNYRRYNCLDACVTYEVWEQQEEEFNARPHLR